MPDAFKLGDDDEGDEKDESGAEETDMLGNAMARRLY
jgi:hypothetical protein